MKWRALLICVRWAVVTHARHAPFVPERGLISSEPTQNWENTLVNGNSKYGALVYARRLDEAILINHGRLFMPLNRLET